MYKLIIYSDVGKLDHEEFFKKEYEMDARYCDIVSTSSIAPTALEYIGNEWYRILGR